MRSVAVALAMTACVLGHTQEAKSLWGVVSAVDGMQILLDDGTAVTLVDGTQVIKVDGTAGAPEDVVRNVKAEVTLGADGNATRVELLPAPLAAEYYLTNLTVRGATAVPATVGGRVYPRSLSALKGSLVGRPDVVTLQGAVAYQPAQGAKAPAGARFAVVNPANDVLFQRTVNAGESAEFRLNFPAGQALTLTLQATPVGEGALQPEWCLWLDPKLVALLPTTTGTGVFKSTAEALLTDLRAALGETQAPPMAVALFVPQRIPDAQIPADLQEDLVIGAVGRFQVVGKSAQRPELGMPLADAVKADLTKMGAQTVLVGSISDRGQMLVVNAALVEVASGQILATARATQ